MFEYNDENDFYDEIVPQETLPEVNELTYYHRSVSISSRRSSRHSSRSDNSLLSRIISKNGRLNTFQVKIPKKYVIYIRDFGNTLLNIRWRWIIITLCLVNFLSFFVFGFMWMFIAHISGDFEEETEIFCIVNTKNFTGYLLLSIETMLTIGYGYRYPTEKCIHAWTVPFLQALISVGIQGALVSAIYVKISKPFTKNGLGIFSKKAVICLRDGKLCFIIRIADLTGKIAIGTRITAYFVDKNFPEDRFRVKQLKIEPHGFLIFPQEITHVIDSRSPFWTLTPQELLTNQIEVILVAEGISTVTGQPSQNKTSYINSDIMWGHRFESCVSFDNKKEKYVINYENINKLYTFDTPLCSARLLDAIAEQNCLH